MEKKGVIGINNIYSDIKKLLYLEDTKLIDLILAVNISRLQRGTKLWLVIVGKSSDGKTALLDLFDDDGFTTKTVKRITPNTLINANKNKSKTPDLAPLLDNKVVLIPEMAQILQLHPEAKAQVLAQLTDLYDGDLAMQSGTGLDIRYKDLNVSLIACSTPMIDQHTTFRNAIGTREMMYRTDDKDDDKLMDKVYENSFKDLRQVKEEIKLRIRLFLKTRKFENEEINPLIVKRIKSLAEIITYLRATALSEQGTGELISTPSREAPTRVLHQLLTLYKSLKSIDDDYCDNKAMEIVKKVVLSSSNQMRIKVLTLLMIYNCNCDNKKGLTSRKVAKELGVSNKVVLKELEVLYLLGLLKKNELVVSVEKELSHYYYMIEETNKVVNMLSDELKIPINLEVETWNLNSQKIVVEGVKVQNTKV
ncbi:MAG: hypothetical protein VXZ40_03150 [Nanoarchaeota archaeon]|nr:hypothetical protein [Nanoarchaeota archaeon]